MSDTTFFDLIVIGAGPGGYVAAIRAAQLGMRVACVEKDESLGGTCLNVGCIPSKALLDSSEMYHQAKHSLDHHGIKTTGVALDLKAMMARKDGVVSQLTRGVAGLFKKNKIEYVRGVGKIAGAGKVEVDGSTGKRTLTAKHILIATGSAPIALKTIPFDGKHIVSSTEALTLAEVPKKLVVIGAGAIGLELGSVWSRLGAEVVVIEFLDRIAATMDREMTTALQRSLEKQGLKFRLKTGAQSAAFENGRVHLTWKSAEGSESGTEECDVVLVAIGRRPFTEKLGMADAGVELDQRGFVVVDKHFQTRVPGIYAIGDVIGGAMLAHKAEEEGVACAEMIAGTAGHVNYLAVPNVIYTYPELASVGITEEEARAKGIEIKIGKFPLMANGRAKAMDATEG
ncbi:MAG: dihydrolipoyl dehydrogenase, partial [Chthoniobacterales bacterium]|nr:dihydrolipoyl dehydrogenase [Chthoniobacterales bacterium]